MFLGDVRSAFAANLVAMSLVADAVHMRGAKTVQLTIEPSGVLTLDDDGDPLEGDWHLWTTIGTRRKSELKWATAPRAVDLAIVAAASESLIAQTSIGPLCFENGMPVQFKTAASSESVRIRCRLSSDVFQDHVHVEPLTLMGWARDYAATVPGVRLLISGAEQHRTFCYPRGLADLIIEEDASRTPSHADPVHIFKQDGGRRLDVALRFCWTGPRSMISFVNHERTVDHGVHVDGVVCALKEALGDRFETSSFTGLVALLHPEPGWAGSVKEQLVNDDVERFTYESMRSHFDLIRARATPNETG
jgi:DNA gyrase/topoisomerase IV subunit B